MEYQIVALQAVMAELLDGDTIHHACGMLAFRRKVCHSEDLQKHLTMLIILPKDSLFISGIRP